MNYKDTMLLINSAIGPKNIIIEKLIEYFIKEEDIIDNFLSEKDNINFISEKDKSIISHFIKREHINKIKEKISNKNINVLTKIDKEYPKKLNYIENSPYILYTKGVLENINDIKLNIGIVGSRKATNYGKWAGNRFAKELTNAGVVITSGMAIGIDSIAHSTCIENKGKTIAVLGSGIDIIYPKRNKTLYHSIINNGLIISEFPLNTQVRGYNFPVRNRIISGLSDGILVIEASDKSGTLITSTYAAEQGIEIFAVPGNIDNYLSKGTNQLIREGAKITITVRDILEEFSFFNERKSNDKQRQYNNKDLDELEKEIISYLKEGSKTIDEISRKIKIEQKNLLSKLTILEMQGIISQEKGKNFRLIN